MKLLILFGLLITSGIAAAQEREFYGGIGGGGTNFESSPTDIALPVDRVFGVGAGLERPCLGFHCKMTLNYFDLGDGDLVEDGGPRLGRIAGSFSKNWAVMLDIQLKKIF